MTNRQWGITTSILITLSMFLYGISYFIPVDSAVLDGQIWILNAIRLAAILIGCLGFLMLGNWLSGEFPRNRG